VTTANERAGKASFRHVYNRDDPRPYYAELKPLEYAMPEVAQPIFERCADTMSALRSRDGLSMIDLCCGYGANTALLRYDVTMAELYDHYTSEEIAGLDPETLIATDRDFFADRERPTAIAEVVGIDVAENAVAYAEEVGLIDHGVAVTLEREEPDETLARFAAETDLITVAGGMGYIGGQTFARLLDRASNHQPPWIAAFPLVTASIDDFRAVFADYGLETEVWTETTYPQRRFVSEAERDRTLERLRELDTDISGTDLDEFQRAAFLLARPRDDIERLPIATIVEAAANPHTG